MKHLLSIAGSDCSGGAGIQADLKTFSAFGHYGMTAITALTAQNTTGVYEVVDLSPDFITKQIQLILDDIPPHAVKVGMVSNTDLIKAIARTLKSYKVDRLVVDPVMVSTSGSKLLSDDAIAALKEDLLPLAKIITPNIHEAEVLAHMTIQTKEDMVKAAQVIYKQIQTSVLIKGGHLKDCADDLLYDGQETWFRSGRIDNDNTHGTGCTLSSAIACGLAEDLSLYDSIINAKAYIAGALSAQLDIGKGSGPLDHFFKHPSRLI